MTIQDVYSKTKNLTVLLVEDEESVRIKTAQMLKDLFLTVNTAQDGEDGLNLYKNFYTSGNKYYDIVITDINMPNLDGLSMVEKMLEINQEQEVIMVSAYGDYEKLQKIINFGIKNYIKKPIEIDEFLEKLYNASLKVEEKKLNNYNHKQIEEFEKLVENSNQIYILFDKDCNIEKIYKSKGIALFDENLVGNDVSNVLYPDNKQIASSFHECFNHIDHEDNELTKKLLTTKLPKEYIHGNVVYLMEYNILSDHMYLLILADQTVHYKAKEELTMQKCECQMMLWAALHKNSFLKLKNSYEQFLEVIEIAVKDKDYETLDEKIQTFYCKLLEFKEKFDIIKMNNARNGIISFENEYSKVMLSSDSKIDKFLTVFKKVNLRKEFEKDIKSITNELSKVLDIE
ncbi:MAG: response regulator [Arcobacteraceae bacterium]